MFTFVIVFSDFYHIGSVIAFFLGMVIILRKDKAINNFILSGWLIILGINIFLFHRLLDHEENNSFIVVLNYLLLLIQFPAPFLFVNSFIRSVGTTIRCLALHSGVPLIIVFIVYFIAGAEPYNPELILKEPKIISYALFGYLFVSMPLYLFLALRGIRKMKQITLEQVSDINNNDFIIIKRFILGILLSYFVFILVMSLSYSVPNITPVNAIGSAVVILSLSVMYAGVFGLQKSDLFIVHSLENQALAEQKRNVADHKQLEEVITKLDQCMMDKKPFLRPRLSLKELSEISLIPESQISAAINTIKEQNFYDYINGLRVEEFINRCKTKDRVEYTLTAIAFECGFNSKSTFFDIFKKQTGQTPSQFVKSL